MSVLSSNMSRLRKLQKEKLNSVQKSYELTIELKDLLDKEQYDACQNLLVDRQNNFDKIDNLNNMITETENKLRNVQELDSVDFEKNNMLIPSDDDEDFRQIVSEIGAIFQKMNTLNKTCEEQINLYRENLLNNLNKLENSKRVRQRYHQVYILPPRFIDKND
ncbi:hypothetical protein [Desulfitobacterium sp.]|uniref:hypothetical protein n=1 Tax=Desulfitobacterium sp. TaxID=49981 RepID=UPI002BAE3E15|nr:hypothetical protein [Desulfitobacterium sp.]HVJ49534.1 hypothetical protein [Desulfitobacterium sp.]